MKDSKSYRSGGAQKEEFTLAHVRAMVRDSSHQKMTEHGEDLYLASEEVKVGLLNQSSSVELY
jgi:hypothetical protein